MSAPQFYPSTYKFTWNDVPKVGTFVEDMVPNGGSVLLFGPAGTGKTTLARLIAAAPNQGVPKAFEQLSAVSASVKDVREVIGRARDRLAPERRGRGA